LIFCRGNKRMSEGGEVRFSYSEDEMKTACCRSESNVFSCTVSSRSGIMKSDPPLSCYNLYSVQCTHCTIYAVLSTDTQLQRKTLEILQMSCCSLILFINKFLKNPFFGFSPKVTYPDTECKVLRYASSKFSRLGTFNRGRQHGLDYI